jgi:hypothetical protein
VVLWQGLVLLLWGWQQPAWQQAVWVLLQALVWWRL